MGSCWRAICLPRRRNLQWCETRHSVDRAVEAREPVEVATVVRAGRLAEVLGATACQTMPLAVTLDSEGPELWRPCDSCSFLFF